MDHAFFNLIQHYLLDEDDETWERLRDSSPIVSRDDVVREFRDGDRRDLGRQLTRYLRSTWKRISPLHATSTRVTNSVGSLPLVEIHPGERLLCVDTHSDGLRIKRNRDSDVKMATPYLEISTLAFPEEGQEFSGLQGAIGNLIDQEKSLLHLLKHQADLSQVFTRSMKRVSVLCLESPHRFAVYEIIAIWAKEA